MVAPAREGGSARKGVRRRWAAIAAALALLAACPSSAAWAQSGGDAPYLDSRERARQDWQAMSDSASSLWRDATAALGPILADPATAIVVAGAALLGGAIGAFARRRPASPPPAPPPAPSRPARRPAEPEGAGRGRPGARQSARREGGGMIFRSGVPGGARSASGADADDAYDDDMPPARKPASRPDFGAEDPELEAEIEEAERLFRFFEERFGLRDRSARAAIDFFTRLSQSIEGLRRRASEAEKERDRLTAEPRGGGGGASSADPGPDAAAWRLISDGMRLCRVVMQNQRGVDPEVQNFESVVDLEEAFVGLAALRAEHLQDGPEGARALDPSVIEQAWPHALFRAEALLNTYYPGRGVWGDLREGVGLIASALRRLLRASGVSISGATLLAPFNPEDGENWSDAAEDLTNLARVRERLRGVLATERQPFVIDIESFGYRDGGRGVNTRARLILLDPEEWR